MSPHHRLVPTSQQTNELFAFNTDALALKKVASVSEAAGPYDVRYSPDGESVCFPKQDAGAVTPVDPDTWQVATVGPYAAPRLGGAVNDVPHPVSRVMPVPSGPRPLFSPSLTP